MKKRIAAAVLAVAVTFGGAVVTAPAADAGVPYSWICRGPGPTLHVYSPAAVGYLVARRGYGCSGGFWRYV